MKPYTTHTVFLKHPLARSSCEFDIKRVHCPVDTGRKLNVHKTFRRRPGRLLNVLCTFKLRPVSAGCMMDIWNIDIFERDYNTLFCKNSNLMGSHSYILGSLCHRHHKFGFKLKKTVFLERVKAEKIKIKKNLISSLHVSCKLRSYFLRSYLQIDTHGPWIYFCLTFGFNNKKSVILMGHARGSSVSMEKLNSTFKNLFQISHSN